jgi:hypothetical protein
LQGGLCFLQTLTRRVEVTGGDLLRERIIRLSEPDNSPR